MWETAQIIKTQLEADGYKVFLTKSSENDTAGLVTKVKRAVDKSPALVVSLHYTGDGTFGTPNAHYGVTQPELCRYPRGGCF